MKRQNRKFKRQIKALKSSDPNKDYDIDNDGGNLVNSRDNLVERILRKREK